MTPEEFRRYGYQMVDLVADYRASVEERPVRALTTPGDVKARLSPHPPAEGESFDAILRDVDEVLMPGLTHWQHPSFFGYFPSNGLLASVLGDYLSTGLGSLGLSWQSSPALSEVEELMADWMRQMTGLSSAWSGVIQDTASTSTLIALLCARERSTNYSLAHAGFQGEQSRHCIYVTAQTHSSVEKAALLAGFGRENVCVIRHDENYAMRSDSLALSMAADVAAGHRPCAVIGTVGTTPTTAVDPIASLAAIAAHHHAWFHVDAAMAGSAMILPECRWMWEGVENADSIVINPHKWLGAAFDCSLYYVRDAAHLVRVMSTNPSYLQSSVDDKVKNLRDWGIPLGRRFRALKLWFLIREQGVEGLQRRLRRDMENAQWLAAEARKSPDWKVIAPVHLQTVCLRHTPAHLTGEALDRHTIAWAERVNASGKAYVTPAALDGHWMVRVSIGAEATERRHVAALWELIQEAASAT